MIPQEIVLPETKPETEWVRGRALRKVSPKRTHSRLQGKFLIALDAWSIGRGEVGPEWRFRVAVPGEARRPLVPDIAFVSYERLRGFDAEELEAPPFAPTVAVEVLSASDLRADVESKIATYLGAGSELVIVIDPAHRTVELHDAEDSRIVGESGELVHSALPGFRLPIGPFFTAALKLPLRR